MKVISNLSPEEELRFSVYDYLLKKQNGAEEELRKKIKEHAEDSSDDFFKELVIVGIIKQGVDGSWTERWKLTNFGLNYISNYVKMIDMKNSLIKISQKKQESPQLL